MYSTVEPGGDCSRPKITPRSSSGASSERNSEKNSPPSTATTAHRTTTTQRRPSTQASERLPPFHQLDLRLDKRWVRKSYQFSIYLDVQNVYNSPNTEAIQYNFNFTSRQPVTGIPILPSVGLRAEM